MMRGRCKIDVVQSAFWQTNTALITDPDGNVVLVDPGVLPDELDRLSACLEPRRIVAALATHEDWDHVLWSSRMGTDVPRLGMPETVHILTTGRGHLLASVAEAEEELGVRWDHHLVGRIDPAPQETIAFGDHFRITFVPTPGHTDGHASLMLEGEGVLFAGDMLSDIDIPMLSDTSGSLDAYRQSLDVLERLVNSAHTIIPGHGAPCDRPEALHRLSQDRAYLDALVSGGMRNAAPEHILPGDPRWHRQENREAHQHHLDELTP